MRNDKPTQYLSAFLSNILHTCTPKTEEGSAKPLMSFQKCVVDLFFHMLVKEINAHVPVQRFTDFSKAHVLTG